MLIGISQGCHISKILKHKPEFPSDKSLPGLRDNLNQEWQITNNANQENKA